MSPDGAASKSFRLLSLVSTTGLPPAAGSTTAMSTIVSTRLPAHLPGEFHRHVVVHGKERVEEGEHISRPLGHGNSLPFGERAPSRQHRGFDIGTDKLPMAGRRGIPHHLIDIAEPAEEYTAAEYARDAAAAIRDIHSRGRLPMIVGGTGFYYRALTRGLFPGPGRDGALRRWTGDRAQAR